MMDPISFTEWVWALNALGEPLITRYQQLGNIEDLEMSIYLYRKALRLSPIHHPYRVSVIYNIASTLGLRYQRLGKIEDLGQSISLYRDTLNLLPVVHRHRPLFLLNLAGALVTRHEQLGDMEDLEQSISMSIQVTSFFPVGNPYRSISSNNLANALIIRYNMLGDIKDLTQSISLYREALSLCPVSHPDRSMSLDNLANGLNTRYAQSGNIEDLEQSISLYSDALSLLPVGHHDRSKSLSNLANALNTRYNRLGNIEDLKRSITLCSQALGLLPFGHPHRAACLNNFANSLSTQFKQSANINDLEQIISLQREAVTLCAVGHHSCSPSLTNLADVLRIRYEQLGRFEDLEESIYLQRKALSLCPVGRPGRPTSLSSLATALGTQYAQFGNIGDLEESISLHREALSLRPVGHPGRSATLIGLATSLGTRCILFDNIVDLEHSITLNREAVRLCPVGHPDRSAALDCLASALRTRCQQFATFEDLDQCISLYHESLSLLSVGHPGLSVSLNNLATAHSTRYKHFGNIDDLDRSISLHREVLSYRPFGHHNRPMSLCNLANMLTIRSILCGSIDNLEESISLHREALAHFPIGHPIRAVSLNNFSMSLFQQYQHFKRVEDLHEVFSCCEEAATDSASYLKDRLAAATGWTLFATDAQHSSTLNAYNVALQLLHRSLVSRSDVKSQQIFLATANVPRSLASDAASAAIQAGNLELAVQFLEQGRAMLWSRIDAYKSPLEQLRQAHGGGELSHRLERINAELERLVLLSDKTATMDAKIATAGATDARMKRHRILSEEWESIVAKVRKIEGFTYFLETPKFDTLRSAAADGPVILLNTSRYRSDAIILTKNNAPNLVALPAINPAELGVQADRLKQSRLTSKWGIISVLSCLWDNIVEPVVTRLRELGVKKKSRIWWCPTGELCSLPLHAARPRDSKKGLPEMYTSSYTSTLSSLIRARTNVGPLPGIPKLLVVGQPDMTLQNVKDEVKIIKQYGKIVNKVLLGAEATHEAVLDGLQNHSWVHFACHGHLGNNDQPFEASFEPHNNHRLTLLDLIRARLPNAECAFLAACHSAAGDSRTPDETIHLSAALQFCGFRSVVGTLWEMDDEDGPMMAKEFYEYMFRNPEKIDFRDSAHALSSAIRAMRKAKLPEDRWVMFVHIGA